MGNQEEMKKRFEENEEYLKKSQKTLENVKRLSDILDKMEKDGE